MDVTVQWDDSVAGSGKTSIVNMLHTRGKRVVAEITLPAALVEEHMNVTTDKLYNARMLGQLGATMSVTNNNGLHSPNGITALFIATGQDVANVAESSAALLYCELTRDGDDSCLRRAPARRAPRGAT